MNEEIFIKKAHSLVDKMRRDYYMVEDILGDAKALSLLCHNFIELKKMEEKDVTDT